MRNTLLVLACSTFAWAQNVTPARAPARMIVTLGHSYGQAPPVLQRDDVSVTQEYEALPITNFVSLRGDRAEIFILVDNCSNCEPGSKFEELRRFIGSQPSTTTIGVAYIQNGRLEVAEKPTADRDRVIKALNPPTGSKPSNPFRALAELIGGWTTDAARRAVVMISNGIDPATSGLQDPSADAALEAAQRGGVTVYVIYNPSADYASADISKIYAGQVQLAHIAYDSGGEAYFLGFGPLPSLAPFLSDIADHLANQYLLEFLAKPGASPGTLQEVKVKSKSFDIELMVPGRVLVPARATEQKPKLLPGSGPGSGR